MARGLALECALRQAENCGRFGGADEYECEYE
jgi:hypothetical protein